MSLRSKTTGLWIAFGILTALTLLEVFIMLTFGGSFSKKYARKGDTTKDPFSVVALSGICISYAFYVYHLLWIRSRFRQAYSYAQRCDSVSCSRETTLCCLNKFDVHYYIGSNGWFDINFSGLMILMVITGLATFIFVSIRAMSIPSMPWALTLFLAELTAALVHWIGLFLVHRSLQRDVFLFIARHPKGRLDGQGSITVTTTTLWSDGTTTKRSSEMLYKDVSLEIDSSEIRSDFLERVFVTPSDIAV